MKTEDRQQAFTIISAALAVDKDHTWMVEKPDERIIMLNSHPFDPAVTEQLVDFYGYGSDDIYPFTKRACTPSKFDLENARFILYLACVKDEISQSYQRDVWAEIRGEWASLLVGGMTNYSGSGGHAYKEMQLVLMFLAEMYEAEIESVEITADLSNQAYALINLAWQEQRPELDEGQQSEPS